MTPQILSVGLVTLAILLGGGYTMITQAIIGSVVGLWLIIKPPHKSPSRLIDLGVVGILAVLIVQFVPGISPSIGWREYLQDLGANVYSGITPQPLYSLQCSLPILIAVGWFYIQSSQAINPDRRRHALQAYGIIISLLALLLFMGALMEWKWPFGAQSQTFSYFPNRNQSSLVIATGGLILFGLAFEGLGRKPVKTILYFLLLFFCCLGLIGAVSRAGILLFIAGCLFWFLISRKSIIEKDRWKMLVSVIVWIIIGLFFLGGGASQRLQHFFLPDESDTMDFRIPVYQDTVELIRDQPLQGAGLGNFQFVFPFYQEQSISEAEVIHPESDWLWWFSELGIVGTGMLLLLSVGLLRGWEPGKNRIDKYRKLAGFVVIIGLLHSFVDVSLHRLGTVLCLIFLYGITRTSRRNPERTIPLSGILFRVLGVVLVMASGLVLIGEVMGRPVHYNGRLEQVEDQLDGWKSEEKNDGLVDRALQVRTHYPLSWEAHYDAGRIALRAGDFVLAEKLLETCLALAPGRPDVARSVGDLWIPYRIPSALIAYRQALRNAPEIRQKSVFRQIRNRLQDFGVNDQVVQQLSREKPAYRVLYLKSAPVEDFRSVVSEEINSVQPFRNWSEFQIVQILWRALEEGMAEELLEYLQGNRSEIESVWPIRVLASWKVNGPEQAFERISLRTHNPNPLSYGENVTTAHLRALLKRDSGDYAAASGLVRRYMESGEWRAALEVLKSIPNWNQVPNAFNHWRALIHWELEEREDSWKYWLYYYRNLHWDKFSH